MSEAALQRAILSALNAQPDCWAMRVNSGSMIVTDKHGKERRIRMAPRGTADVIFCGPGGLFGAIEVKVPGNKPTEAQSLWLHRLAKLGAFTGVAHSAGEALEVVRRMRERAGRSGLR